MKPIELIASRFEIETRVSVRGGSQVYSGRDRESGLPVAIKMFAAGKTKPERFEREATFLTEFSHPGIVKHIAHGTADGQPFLVMEWIEGPTLAQVMDRGLTLHESVAVVRLIADALASVHVRGVVHRDVKPSNIIFPEGKLTQAKLLDFGVARRVGLRSNMTRTGAIVGTPAYMSPEQARGIWKVNARSDVFSLGCVLYACMCGRPAFAAAHLLATLTAILFLDPKPVKEVCPEAPDELCDLVTRMLAKDPACRPGDAGEVAEALAGFGDLPDDARRPFNVGIQRWQRRGRAEDTITTQTSMLSQARIATTEAPFFLLAAIEPDDDDDDDNSRGEGDSALAPGGGSKAETASGHIDPNRNNVVVNAARELVGHHGGLSAMLTDGTFVAMFAASKEREEQAARAAGCALALRKVLPEAPIVVGQGEETSVSAVLDRLVETLVEESFRGLLDQVQEITGDRPIRLGDRMSAQLAARVYGVKRIGGADYLVESSS